MAEQRLRGGAHASNTLRLLSLQSAAFQSAATRPVASSPRYLAGWVEAIGRISSSVKPVNLAAFATQQSKVADDPANHGLPGWNTRPFSLNTTCSPFNS